MSQRDLLGECNTEGEALPIFQEAWCRRCINPDCTRSAFGSSRFDIRVNSWEERLFRNPPRMAPVDPRYKGIAGKKFLTLTPGNIGGGGSGWVDPDVPTTTIAPPPPTVAPPRPPPPPPTTTVAPRPPVPRPPQPIPQSVPPTVRPETFQVNAPSQSGKVLPGGPTAQNPNPNQSSWDPPSQPDNIVPVGGKVRFRRG